MLFPSVYLDCKGNLNINSCFLFNKSPSHKFQQNLSLCRPFLFSLHLNCVDGSSSFVKTKQISHFYYFLNAMVYITSWDDFVERSVQLFRADPDSVCYFLPAFFRLRSVWLRIEGNKTNFFSYFMISHFGLTY